MSFTGNFLSAEEALQFGLVNHVVAHDDLLPFTRSLATDIIGNDQAGVRQIRAHVRRDHPRRRRLGAGGARLAGRGSARCSAPRRSPSGAPRSSAAAGRSDADAPPSDASDADGGGHADVGRARSAGRVVGAVALGVVVAVGAVAAIAAAPQRPHPGRRLRAVPAPGPQPVRRRHRPRSSPTTASPCSTPAARSARSPTRGAGRCCCRRSSRVGLDYDRLKLRRGGVLLRVARARPRHRPPARRAPAGPRRHRRRRHRAGAARAHRPAAVGVPARRRRRPCSSGGSTGSSCRTTADRRDDRASSSCSACSARAAYNVRRESVVLVGVDRRRPGRRAARVAPAAAAGRRAGAVADASPRRTLAFVGVDHRASSCCCRRC